MENEFDSERKFLVVLVGPTAVGKTAISIDLAKYFQTEILSCDSRQCYRETDIGTAKPSVEELNEVKHHFINEFSIHDAINVGYFEKHALNLLEKLFDKKDVVIMVGGSGLYADALCYGLDEMPKVEVDIRSKLVQQFELEGLEFLNKELEKADPEYFGKVDLKNPQRVIRALEVIRSTGKPFSSFRNRDTKKRPFQTIRIGLSMNREKLFDRIDTRMDTMIAQGLFEEAQQLYPIRHLNALQTVGYTEIFDFLDGKYDKEEAIRLLKRNSRRYAKRQMTWFNRNEETLWFDQPTEFVQVVEEIQKMIKP
jgi:tRNA dimethylallyltransferase